MGSQQWLDSRRTLIEQIADLPDVLRSTARYRDVPSSEEERKAYEEEKGIASASDGIAFAALFQQKGMPAPLLHPNEKLVNLYLSIKPPRYYSEEPGIWWATLFTLRNAVIGAMTEQLEPQFIAELSKYETPLGILLQEVGYEYVTPYYYRFYVELGRHTPEEQALIKEYYQTTSPFRRGELQQVKGDDGSKLISGVQERMEVSGQNLRLIYPEVDAWLVFWGFTDTPLTPKARQIYLELCQEHGKQP
jgi:hypothetical protein